MIRFAVGYFVVRRFTVGRLLSQSVVVVTAHFVSSPLSLSIARQLPQQFSQTLGEHLHFPQTYCHTSCVSNCPTFHRAFKLIFLNFQFSVFSSSILYLKFWSCIFYLNSQLSLQSTHCHNRIAFRAKAHTLYFL